MLSCDFSSTFCPVFNVIRLGFGMKYEKIAKWLVLLRRRNLGVVDDVETSDPWKYEILQGFGSHGSSVDENDAAFCKLSLAIGTPKA
jgi:hypothetical protein